MFVSPTHLFTEIPFTYIYLKYYCITALVIEFGNILRKVVDRLFVKEIAGHDFPSLSITRTT